MDREQLLKEFLGLYPDSTHPLDRRRFLKYALACVLEDSSLNTEAMIDSEKISSDNIEKYEIAYGWIRDTFEYIIQNLDLGSNYEKILCSLKSSL